jgi:stringent starvation protein B
MRWHTYTTRDGKIRTLNGTPPREFAMPSTPEIPTKPYLIRALYEWCVDCGHTPYLAVTVNSRTRVPKEFVKNGEIVLNIGAAAVHKLSMGNDAIEFAARFNGVSRDISVPIDAIAGIYARETGQGMAFEVTKDSGDAATAIEAAKSKSSKPGKSKDGPPDDTPPRPPGPPGRPKLQIVK